MRSDILHEIPLDVLPLDSAVDDLILTYEPMRPATRAVAWMAYTDQGARVFRLALALGGILMLAFGDVPALLVVPLAILLVCAALGLFGEV